MSDSISFYIKSPPSLNVQNKWHFRTAKKFRDSLVLEMLACCPKRVTAHERLLLATDKPKRIVKFTRYWYVGKVDGAMVNVKELDGDNFIGGCKPVLDELKLVTWRGTYMGHKFQREGLSLIFDDAPQYCCVMHDQVKNKKKAGQLLIEVQ